MTLYTVGHSTRAAPELKKLLEGQGIELLVDIRTVPRSRHNPQFNVDVMPDALAPIAYRHMRDLGGLRRPRPDSINTGLRNSGFRGYADYMQTDTFALALDELCELASRQKTAVMGAEAVPWRCHRSLLADAFTARGGEVLHIMSETVASPHRLTGNAVVKDNRVRYPRDAQENLFA